MTLSQKDLNAIQLLMQTQILPIDTRLTNLEERITKRFNTMDGYFDSLFKQYETTRLENAVIMKQLSRFDNRITALESKTSNLH